MNTDGLLSDQHADDPILVDLHQRHSLQELLDCGPDSCKQGLKITSAHVACSHPDNLWWRALDDDPIKEIRILCKHDTAISSSTLPDFLIGEADAEVGGVDRAGPELLAERAGQILVDEERIQDARAMTERDSLSFRA